VSKPRTALPCPKLDRTRDPDLIAWVRTGRDGTCLGMAFGTPCAGGLDVHHIQTRGSGGDDAVENLITLCRKHHSEAHTRRIEPEDLQNILRMLYGYPY
jgi:5-methylcytosine-specific restriction endonuclease McrA